MLPNLPDIQGEKAKQLISNQPGVNGLAGVMKDKSMFFEYLWITLSIFCMENLIRGYSIGTWTI